MSTSETRDQKDREHGHEHGPDADRASSSGRDPLGPFLESFLARFRKGERPSLTEYVGLYPGLADEIRELLPALIELEQLGSLCGTDRAGSGDQRPAGSGDPCPAQPGDPRPEQGAPSVTEPCDPAAGLAAAVRDGTVGSPQRLGDYRILRCIGEGGMGVVYEAVRQSLRSHVALKVMHPRYRANRGYLRRFHNEARLAAQLHHTNIVSVFDYGEHDGVCYYAMRYIAGHSLDKVLAEVKRFRQGLSPEQAAPAGARPAASTIAGPVLPQAPGTEADPLLRAVTHGLLNGQFAPGAAGTRDRNMTPSPTTEPIATGMVARTVATDDLVLAVGPAGIATEGCDHCPDSLSSSPAAGHDEDRYHRMVAHLGAQVADALEYAHQRGVLHRDIKPSNLLLDAIGNVWVTDFGLAKFEEGEDLSQSQDVVGTLRYMAPERFRGDSDRRCDIYALGATLYELLTLRPAFESPDRLRLIDQIVHKPPAPPRQLDRRIPRDLETIVLKALAKEPKDRFATADDLAAELRRFLENRPIQSRPISTYERFWRWCKRNPGLAALNALAATLTTIIAIVSTVAAWTYYRQSNALRVEQSLTEANLHRAEHAEQGLRLQLDRTTQAERQAGLALGQSLVSEGAALQRNGLIGQRFDSLDRLGQAARVLGADPEGRKRLPEIRNRAIAALGLTDLQVRRQHDCGDVWGLSVDAALKRYAVMEHSGIVVVRRLDDDRELLRLPEPAQRDSWFAWSGFFSPDGELLVTIYALTGGRGNLLRIWRLERRELLGSLPSPGALAFHPDGHRLLFSAPEGGIGVWDRRERRVVRRLPLDFPVSNMALDREGRRLAVNNTDAAQPQVVILELETGRVLSHWRSEVGNSRLAWSADGQLLAVGGERRDPRVFVWNVGRGELGSVLQGHTNEIISAQFAHSGYLLATSSWDGTTRLWDAVSGAPLATAPGWLRGFSPDDRRLAFKVGGTIGVWDVAGGNECRTLHPGMLGNRSEARDATGVTSADVSPDGRLVATCGGDGVRLWEVDTGRELAHLQAGLCETMLFHPDGRSLISSGEWGLYRWPIQPDSDRGPDTLRVGPPELLWEPAGGGGNHATWLPQHRTLALTDNVNARVLLVDSSHPHPARSRATTLDSGENRRMTSVAVSPDGCWLAVGGWKEAGVRVWDLRRRRLERILRPNDALGDMHFFIGFSPDGRWLVSCTHSEPASASYHFWRVGTWDQDRRIDQERSGIASYPPAFSRDGRMMALGIAPDQVLLADAVTGRELARLTTLQPVTPAPLAFSPDGTSLVARTNQKTALVWDLRRIREQLASMGMDWDAPPYLPEGPPSETTTPGVDGVASRASGGSPQVTASDWGLAASKAGSTVAPRSPEGKSSGTKLCPIRLVRVVGEVIEPQARRAAELAEMNRRLAANPRDAEALVHRGWLFLQQKKRPEAIADLQRLTRLRPDHADACWLLAEAYEETGDLNSALAAFSRLLEQRPEDRDARFQRGLLALALARPDLAAGDFNSILAAEPARDDARYRRAEAFIRHGRYREALADLDMLISKDPSDDAYYELRGIVLEALGDHEPARADRERANGLLPKDAMALNSRAWILATGPISQRDPERAMVLAQRAVALAPGQQALLNTLGVALYRAGQYAEAVSVLERSLVAGKGEFDAFDLLFLAMARHRLGQTAQAQADFNRAVRSRREHPKPALASWSEELDRFCAEAVAVLTAPSDELPADLFTPAPRDGP